MSANERNACFQAMVARMEPGIDRAASAERSLASIAISLKRIADALEPKRIGPHLGSPPPAPFDHCAGCDMREVCAAEGRCTF